MGRQTLFGAAPDANPDVKSLSQSQKDYIYFKSHVHNGCYNAIGLYQYFWELCPPEQMISVHIKNKVSLSRISRQQTRAP